MVLGSGYFRCLLTKRLVQLILSSSIPCFDTETYEHNLAFDAQALYTVLA